MNFASSKLKYSLFALVFLLMVPAFPHVAADSGNNHNNFTSTTIPVGTGPAAIDVLPALSKVFVANFGINCNLAAILYAVQNGGSLGGACDYGNSITVINTKTNTVSDTVNVEAGPFAIVADQFRNKVYVADFPSGDIQVINGRTDAVTTCVSPGQGTDSVSVNPFTNVIYATNIFGLLLAIDASSCTVIGTAPTGNGPIGNTVDPLTNTVYVTNLFDGTVSVFNGKTLNLKTTVNVGSAPTGVEVDPLLGKVYVANSGGWGVPGFTPDNTISVISAWTNRLISTVTVGQGPAGVAVNVFTHQVYVCNFGSFSSPGTTVSVIDGKSLTVSKTLTAGNGPSEVIANPLNSAVYVMNFFDNSVTAFTPSGHDNQGGQDNGGQNGQGGHDNGGHDGNHK